jgi:glucose-6-phosphate isomerase
MSDRLVLDYNRMLAPATGGRGIEPAARRTRPPASAIVHADVERAARPASSHSSTCPTRSTVVEQIRSFADGSARRSTPSSCSASAAPRSAPSRCRTRCCAALERADDEARDYFPRLYVLDNVDPSTIGPLLDRLDPRRTLYNVVSKSGTTAETMAQFMIVRERLRAGARRRRLPRSPHLHDRSRARRAAPHRR